MVAIANEFGDAPIQRHIVWGVDQTNFKEVPESWFGKTTTAFNEVFSVHMVLIIAVILLIWISISQGNLRIRYFRVKIPIYDRI